jgi:cell wall-associated NlpC family hydrolase
MSKLRFHLPALLAIATLAWALPAVAEEVVAEPGNAVAASALALPAAALPAAMPSAEGSLIERTGAIAANVAANVVEGVGKTIGRTGEIAGGLVDGVGKTIDRAIELVGIPYKRGGTSPETGFDCSGFVSHVFQEGVGLVLPHNARAMSKSGEVVRKEQLQPGDLVFFNTMRRTFSHVGIYLGGNRFIHAPHTGGDVRVENLGSRYWLARFNGARRIAIE